MNRNEAYDFSLFEKKNKQQAVRDNVVNVKIQKSKQRNFAMPNTGLFLLAFVLVSLVALMIQGQVELTELTEKTNTLRKDLEISQSACTQLTVKEESKTSLRDVEERAKELGMEKVGTKQIEYINMPMVSKAQVKSNGNILLDKVKNMLEAE